MTTSLQELKVCRYELGYNETVCNELHINPAWDEAEAEVQTKVNDLELVIKWISHIPPIIYIPMLGALADSIGTKWIIFFPMFGKI